MRKITILLSLIVFISYFSCSRDDIVTPEKALLKIKYWYHSINDTIPIRTSEYQYDNRKRLEKINYYKRNTDTLFIYDLFEYTMNNELVNKYTYHYANDSLGWLLSDSTHYGYENVKLILEETYYPPPNSYQVSFQYEYENSKIVKKYRYVSQQFLHCITYDYANEVCIKETRFTDYNLNVIGDYTIHYFDEELLLRSEKYTPQNQNFQIIAYTYNDAGNLIIEESKGTEFPVAKPMDYVIRYEYY